VGRALQAALAPLCEERGSIGALKIVQNLLDGKPCSMTSDNPDSIRLCIAVAHAIGARVEGGAGPLSDALPPGLRSIRFYPASQAEQ
jgi:hypothetical protein